MQHDTGVVVGIFIVKTLFPLNQPFSVYFSMLQPHNFNVVDIVIRCCNETYNLNSGLYYNAL
jgi:hypothetical protein